MTTDPARIDHETVYRLIYERRWTAVLEVAHRRAADLPDDPLLARALRTFVPAFFDDLDRTGDDDAFAEALEKLVLLHTGGFFRVPDARFEAAVERLVRLHADRPEKALDFARFCPGNERCAAVLRQYGPAESAPVAHPAADAVRLTESRPLTPTDATVSLFKSRQEVDFFLAVREVFATYFVYPNVALSSLVDYERIADRLTGEERRYFFRALVDCVVFDQHDGYRPRFFFELDSPLHDDEARRKKDTHKERILALAGQKLYRIRAHDRERRREDFVAMLKALAT